MIRRNGVIAGLADDGWGQRKRRQSDIDLDITPMIDVTFLLLIFFMVTSTMQPPNLDVPPAKHGIGVDSGETTIITVKSPKNVGGGEPVIRLAAGGTATLEEVRLEVERAVGERRYNVVIKADREVPHGFIQQIARTINTIEGVRFYYGVRDKQAN